MVLCFGLNSKLLSDLLLYKILNMVKCNDFLNRDFTKDIDELNDYFNLKGNAR